ncbi:MAG: hypothetical protein VW870_04140 [Rhodobiaceae bacterium]
MVGKLFMLRHEFTKGVQCGMVVAAAGVQFEIVPCDLEPLTQFFACCVMIEFCADDSPEDRADPVAFT